MRRLVPILAGLAVVACDGSGADDYRDDANAICQRVKEQIAQVEEPAGPEDVAGYIREVGRIGARGNDDFARLDPPDDLRADHDRLVELNEQGRKAFDRLAERIEGSDRPAVTAQRELSRIEPLIERSRRVNERLDLDECTESLAPPGQAPARS